MDRPSPSKEWDPSVQSELESENSKEKNTLRGFINPDHWECELANEESEEQL